ncbi:succinylglutamate desuccinylase [Pelagibius litoralis]|uniref:Succinylglutamate desuccinylase n=1 Tax=Pelagibius litoralis TaxID=374515 RepID=A0A967EV17_9PROT|nr:succinylglutamate desuccinylase/aspartoacylase family protein [Pelagibius litoralis]NIA67862.1 succinylglutamate desuccinylase [Pelagibius litoralis]
MLSETRVWSKIDLSKDGKQADCLRLPYSSNLSAYGWLPVPIVCIKNGEGPTALLVAGNHGDEYEGQVALLNLARRLGPGDVRGRIIVLPALNAPAAAAGTRNSPVDGGNLNRSFPGDPYGQPTAMLAHYVDEVLFPTVDIAVDLHSGGRSLEFLPCALMRPGRTPAENRVLKDALRAFAAPISYITSGKGGGGPTTLAAAAERYDVPTIMTELGGGETISRDGLRLAEEGLQRLLVQQGILIAGDLPPGPETRFMEVAGPHYFVYAPEDGLFEPLVALGDTVVPGQTAGRLHFPNAPLKEPVTVPFDAAGLVACRRVPSIAQHGDCLFHLLSDAVD